MWDPDRPINKTDEDALHRRDFAESLAGAMLNHKAPEGFAIGMHGKWGSGKTSVINMVLEHIESLSTSQSNKPVILRFNPWLCSDPKQLITQFFKQLSSAIEIKEPKLDKICRFMENYANAFELAGLIPVAGNILAVIGKELGEKAKAHNESNNDLQKIKDNIIEELSKAEVKIIVVIDDIDRLSKEEIISVFQLVKSLADFPHTIYLLAFDREVVIKALKDVQNGDGGQYLEKIIQVPFELPEPDIDDIQEVFFIKFNPIISNIPEEKWDKEYWGGLFNYGIRPYLQSVRDVVLFANVFALKYSLLCKETNVIDLLGLTCIQVFEPIVYSRLSSHKKQLCGGPPGYSYKYDQEKEKVQESYDMIIEGLTGDKAEKVKAILLYLFPKISKSIYSFRNYSHYQAFQNGSISNPDCFDRYFKLKLEPTAIPLQEIEFLLLQADEETLAEEIIRLNALGKTIKFLEHIRAVFEPEKGNSKYAERAKTFLIYLLVIGNN